MCSDPPALVTVEATNSCNLACVMCPVPSMLRPRGFLAPRLLRWAIRGLPAGTRLSLSNWGEPLLHPEIVELVGQVTSAGLLPELVTNGLLLTDSSARDLAGAGLARLSLSVDATGGTYEQIRGVAFERVEAVLPVLAILRGSCRLSIRTTLQPGNTASLEQLERIRRIFAGHVDELRIQRMVTWGRAERSAPCPAPLSSIVMLHGGEVVPCCADHSGALTLGRVSAELSLLEIWRSGRLQALREQHGRLAFPEFCRTCCEWSEGPAGVGYRFDARGPATWGSGGDPG